MRLFFLLFFFSCSKAPISGDRQFLLTSEKTENQQGAVAYKEIIGKEKETTNQAQANQVRKVSQDIAAVSGRPDLDWEFRTLESDQPNAFCLPGGKIAVYTGILPFAQNEAGLAAIVGHEVGHALARHGGQRMSQHLATGVGLGVLGILLGSKTQDPNKTQLAMAALGAGVAVGVMLPFSRSHEKEADEIGLILMAKAGYDPREAIEFWNRFAKAGGKRPPEFLSTHPHSKTRAKLLRKQLPKAMEIYRSHPSPKGLGAKLTGI